MRTSRSIAPAPASSFSASSNAATVSGSACISSSWKWRTTPTRSPATEGPTAPPKSGGGTVALAGSSGSWAASTPIISAQSSLVQHIGPAWSSEKDSGSTPRRLTRP